MKKFLFILMLLGVFTFAYCAKAQTMASAQPLPQSEVSTFYAQVFHLEVEKSAILLEGEQKSSVALDVASEDNAVYTNESTDEGMFCVVRDKKGNKVAGCFICNCAELTRAYWANQPQEQIIICL